MKKAQERIGTMRRILIAGIFIFLLFMNGVHSQDLKFIGKSYQPDANAPRSSVPKQYQWDLSMLFADDSVWEKTFADVKDEIKGLAAHMGKLKTSEAIKTCLDEYFKIRMTVERLSAYASLNADEDNGVAQYQEMQQRALDLENRFRMETAFIRLELLEFDEPIAKAILENSILAPYRSYITDLRRRRGHRLQDETEKVLGLAGDNLWAETGANGIPSDVELIFKAVQRDIRLPRIKDEKGKWVQITLANYNKYRGSKDRRVRRDTVTGFFGALKDYQDILAATLAAEIKRDVFMARAREYATAVQAYLDRQDVPPEMIQKLIDAVHANLAPLHRYVELRKKILNLKELHLYDLYTPLAPAAEVEIPYAEGVKDILEALRPLGSDYSAKLSSPAMLDRRMIDIYPNKGKYPGGYAFSTWGLAPLVLLNYQNDLEDVFTTAHELGHAVHSLINMQAQPYPDFGYSSFTAEIASTFNEMLLIKYLLAKYQGNPRARLFLLGRLVENIRTTIYRQTLFTEFELKIHGLAETGKPITAELLNKTYADLVKFYYGSGFFVDQNDGVEWAYVPHFYWKYYMYSYACGMASAIALSEKVAAGDQVARDQYLEMLAKPRETHPIEILRQAGVDLLKPDAVLAAARLMDETMTEIEKLVFPPAKAKKKKNQ